MVSLSFEVRYKQLVSKRQMTFIIMRLCICLQKDAFLRQINLFGEKGKNLKKTIVPTTVPRNFPLLDVALVLRER